MVSWKKLVVARGLDHESDLAWQIAWRLCYTEHGASPSGALFHMRRPLGAGVLYFSPGAQELANLFGAEPCVKPAAGRLRQVAGDKQAWELHFGRVGRARVEASV